MYKTANELRLGDMLWRAPGSTPGEFFGGSDQDLVKVAGLEDLGGGMTKVTVKFPGNRPVAFQVVDNRDVFTL